MRKIAFILFICFNIIGCGEINSQSNQSNQLTLLDANSFEKLIQTDKNVQLIDVRSPQEVANGYILNAVNISIADTDFKERMNKLDKSKPVAVYCAAGGRSKRASTMLSQMGFKTVYDLEGGMTAWNNKNKPTVKK